MAVTLGSMGVRTAWDYAMLPETTVRSRFHLPGLRTWKGLKRIPCVGFEGVVDSRKSICVSRSFEHEIFSQEEFCEQVTTFAASAVSKLRGQSSYVREMIVFAMTNRFKEDLPQTYGGLLTPPGSPLYDPVERYPGGRGEMMLKQLSCLCPVEIRLR